MGFEWMSQTLNVDTEYSGRSILLLSGFSFNKYFRVYRINGSSAAHALRCERRSMLDICVISGSHHLLNSLSIWLEANNWIELSYSSFPLIHVFLFAKALAIDNFAILVDSFLEWNNYSTCPDNDTPLIGQSRDFSSNVLRNKTGYYSSPLNSTKTALNNIWPLEASHLK